MTYRMLHSAILPVAAALSLAACDNSVDALTEHGGETAVFLSQGTVESESSSSAASFFVEGSSGPISLSQVKSIDVAITSVKAVRQGTPETEVVLNVVGPPKINLVSLPSTAQNALVLARGTLPAGTYTNLRLVFSEAFITFKTDVAAGHGPHRTTLKANTTYALDIGGGPKNELKVPGASFTVSENTGERISVTFDAGASASKIIITGNGQIKMPPVIHAKKKDK